MTANRVMPEPSKERDCPAHNIRKALIPLRCLSFIVLPF
jgi:hypothetical protein